MILIKKDLINKITFEENVVNILVIENKNYFISVIDELLKQSKGEEGTFSIFFNNNELKFSDKVEVIDSVFNLDLKNKKILNKIYIELEKSILDSEFFVYSKELEYKIFQFICRLSESYDFPLSFNDNIDWKEIFKTISLRLSTSFNNKIEEIIEYIELVNKVLNKNIFVLINFHSFFNKDEIKEFYKQCFYKKINLLVIESKEPDIILLDEKLFIIDENLCEINLFHQNNI